MDNPPGKTVGRRSRECGGGGRPPALSRGRDAGGRFRYFDCIKVGATTHQHLIRWAGQIEGTYNQTGFLCFLIDDDRK